MTNIQNQTIWPLPTLNSLSLKRTLKVHSLALTHYSIPKKAIQYIAYICHNKNYSIGSFQQCLSLAAKYLSKNNVVENIQLVLMSSLLLVTKILQTDNLTINELHELSNHCFTNREIHLMEEKICQSIQFQILNDGLPSRKIKIILAMIKCTLPEHSHYYLDSISQDVELLFWAQFYSKSFDVNTQVSQFNFDLAISVIVQISLILMTQTNGSFPQITWISSILGVKKQSIQQVTSRYLKSILGKQFTKALFI